MINADEALYAHCAYLSEYTGRIARERRYTDSDYDYLDNALDIASALLSDSYDGTSTLQTLIERLGCTKETFPDTLLSCPNEVKEYILSS